MSRRTRGDINRHREQWNSNDYEEETKEKVTLEKWSG